MDDHYAYVDSIHVAAPPREVYRAVSDVTRHGEWSVFCVRGEWDEGSLDADGSPRVGARFTGFNVKPDRQWETRSEVVVADPGREFAWEVNGGLVRWGYVLEPDGGGTRLTQSWAFSEAGREFIHERFGAGDRAEGDAQVDLRVRDARRSIPETLAAIKKVVEG